MESMEWCLLGLSGRNLRLDFSPLLKVNGVNAPFHGLECFCLVTAIASFPINYARSFAQENLYYRGNFPS